MRHRDDTRALAELAARQNGNATHRQLVDAGLSRDQIKRRREAGRLVLRHTGVFAVGYVPGARESAGTRRCWPSPAPIAAEVIARPGARGNGKLRKVLEGAVDPAEVRSVLEIRFLRMCAAQGLPRPQVNVRIGEWTPDFYWPEWRLVVGRSGRSPRRNRPPHPRMSSRWRIAPSR
jgi:hypothetical protein